MEETTFAALDQEIERTRNEIARLQARIKTLLEKRTLLKSNIDPALAAQAARPVSTRMRAS
jgi:hypothetical protein